MAKKTKTATAPAPEKPVPNPAQLEYIKNNCWSHTEADLAQNTGLDIETVTALRAEAMKDQDGELVRNMAKLHDGVFAINQGVSEMIGDRTKNPSAQQSRHHEEQRRQREAHQATFIYKIRPDK